MTYGVKVKTHVRAAYVFQRLNVPAVAKRFKVPEQTLKRWKAEARAEGDDWDKARAAHSLAGDGAEAVAIRFMDDFMRLLDSTMEDIKGQVGMKPAEKVDALARLSDAYNKAMAGVRRSVPQVSELAIAMDVLQQLVKFVQTRYPAHAKALVEILDPFAAEVAKYYG
jgi:hypothetical protein